MWRFRPRYRFILQKRDPKTLKTSTWALTSMLTCNATLVTQAGVGTLQAEFADSDLHIIRNIEPHDMDVVRLQLMNRHGQWANAWTGYVDEVHHISDPARGEIAQIQATSPYKLWEVTSETYSDAVTMAVNFARNVTGSTVLRYSARAVGFPFVGQHGGPMLIIDPTADVGTGMWSNVAQQSFYNPDQQSWSAVIQGLLADSGLEFFFDENGRGIYRQVGFLGTPGIYNAQGQAISAPYRRVVEEDIMYADVAESDRGVLTDIRGRWGGQIANQMSEARWPDPNNASASAIQQAMETQLGKRLYIAYFPWVRNKAAAQFLTQVLWQQMAANVMHALITIPADPFFRIGSVIAVPSLRYKNQGLDNPDLFYLSSITYQLEWGQTWVMSLGLQYGRKNNQSFPYVGGIAAPSIGANPQITYGLPGAVQGQNQIIVFNANNPHKVDTPFQVQVKSSLQANQVALDPSFLAPGATVQLRDAKTGKPIGPGTSSDYTVVAGNPGTTLYIKSNPTSAQDATIIIVSAQPDPTTVTGTGTNTSAPDTTGASPGTGTGSDSGTGPTIQTPPQSILKPTTTAQKVLAYAWTLRGPHYQEGLAGPTAWDCSGLVAWAYSQFGFQGLLTGPNGGSFGDIGPNGEYYYFLNHGAKKISVDAAQPGDLLFIQEPNPPAGSYAAKQDGFSHVGFCLQPGGYYSGVTYGGNNPDTGLSTYPIGGFWSWFGTKINLALDMSGVHI